MMMPAETRLIVTFGDSITDGTASTMNGDDRWRDVLARRLHSGLRRQGRGRQCWDRPQSGCGSARVFGREAFSGGPSAGARLERDVLSLSGVSAVIWLEGINDFRRTAMRQWLP